MICMIQQKSEKAFIAEDILHRLPDWFGIPESTAMYVQESSHMPFWAAMEGGKAVGFIALKETSPETAELYVMGVIPDHHHQGIGTALFREFAAYAARSGYRYLQVKTVEEGHYAEYDQTVGFYRAMGFSKLDVFPTLWDEWNPCLIMVKAIGIENG